MPIGPPGDQDIFTNQIKTKRGMNRIAQRVENCTNFIINHIGQWHCIEGRKPKVLGKGSLNIYTNAFGLWIKVELAGAGLSRLLAN